MCLCDEKVSDEILEFWFEGSTSDNVKRRWFLATGSAEQAAFDARVCEKYGATLESALTGAFDVEARRSARGTLALVVLLDQLSRHIHRSAPERLVACDERAVALTRHALDVIACISLCARVVV